MPIAAVAFPLKVFFKNRVARIVGVFLEFSNQKDVYEKGIQKYRADLRALFSLEIKVQITKRF